MFTSWDCFSSDTVYRKRACRDAVSFLLGTAPDGLIQCIFTQNGSLLLSTSALILLLLLEHTKPEPGNTAVVHKFRLERLTFLVLLIWKYRYNSGSNFGSITTNNNCNNGYWLKQCYVIDKPFDEILSNDNLLPSVHFLNDITLIYFYDHSYRVMKTRFNN